MADVVDQIDRLFVEAKRQGLRDSRLESWLDYLAREVRVAITPASGLPIAIGADGTMKVGDVIRALGYSPAVADEVVSFLKLVDDRDRRVNSLAGEARLMETESVVQSYAAAFHREMLETVAMVDSSTLLGLLEPLGGVQDVRSFTKRLRDSSQVIALKTGRTFVYPLFQFDPGTHRVRDVVAQTNSRLLAAQDPWGALAWWTTPNPRWEQRRPIDSPDEPSLVALVDAGTDDGF